MIQPTRFVEAAALLPLLHTPVGNAAVACIGPTAEMLAAEALRWTDVNPVLMLSPPEKIKDRRITMIAKLQPASCDVILLSPEQSPDMWRYALKPNGIMQALTMDPEKIKALCQTMYNLFGNATPWREHTPDVLYGVISRNGASKPERVRRVPGGAKRLSEAYIPCLFTFGKDELPSMVLYKQNQKPA